MRFWRRRSPGRHALGAAVTGIPSAVPRPAAGTVQVPVQGAVTVPVPVPRTAVVPPLPAPSDAAAGVVPLPACAPVSAALEHALVDLLLQEQVSERPPIVVAQPPLTAGVETSPLTPAFASPAAAPAVAPSTARPTPVAVPSVELGFRDGSTVTLHPSSAHARSLQTLARALTTLD